MKRHERRQKERAKKKSKKSSLETELITTLAKSMKEFHERKEGNLIDWLLTIDVETLRKMEIGEENEDEKGVLCMAMALMANAVSTGSNEFVDENPATENSTLYKLVNTFSFYVSSATLCRLGLIEMKVEWDCFFDIKEDAGVYFKVKEND